MNNSLKMIAVFFLTLFALCFFTGVIYTSSFVESEYLGPDLINSFKIINLNSLILEVAVISISFLLSFFLIGVLLFIAFVGLKAFSLGLITYSFISTYGFSGMIISVIHLLLNIVLILLLFMIFFHLLKLLKLFVNKNFLKKTNDSTYIIKLIKKCFYIFTFYLSYNIILYLSNDLLIEIYKKIIGV